MYCQYFSLKKKPFQISPDNAFLWLGRKHAKALKTIQTGMAQNQGLLTLVGDVGTGKTTLINEIIHTLDNETIHVKIADPYFEINQIYQVIAQTLGFEHQDQKKFSSTFYSFLKSTDNTKKVVVIFDEAQRISQRLLEEIISWSKEGLSQILTIILAGQLEFQDLITASHKPELKKLIKINALLEPLNEQETMDYIKKRLELAGTKRNIFLKTAIHAIYNYSKGIPRIINITCDQALIAAFANNMKIIDVPTLQQAINPLVLPNVQPEKQILKTSDQSLERQSPSYRQRSIPVLFAGLAAAVCIFIAYLLYTGYFPSARETKLTSPADNLTNNLDNTLVNKPVDVKSDKQKPVVVKAVIQKPMTVLTVKKEPEKTTSPAPIDPILDVKVIEPDIRDNQASTDIGPEKSGKQEITLGFTPALPENELDESSLPVNETDPEAIIDWLLERKKSN